MRYPPAIADGRALVGSGDGYAYAFEAATGGCCGGSAPPRPSGGSPSTTRCSPRGRSPAACWSTATRPTSPPASTTTTARTSTRWTRPAVRSSGETAARKGWARSWVPEWRSRGTCCWTMGNSTLPVAASCHRPRSTWPPGSSPQRASGAIEAANCNWCPPRTIAANRSAGWWPLASRCTRRRRARCSSAIPNWTGAAPS